MYNKLQYISQGNTVQEQLHNIQLVLDNGCTWIQLRFKNSNYLYFNALSEKIKLLCESYKAILIINDRVDVALKIASDGVHLGLDDMKIKDARALLGSTKIIGATANTFSASQNLIQNGCDYIGLGPFQFTKTKDNLSPILGLDGYRSIITQLKAANIEIPIYAIGGITLENVDSLLEMGIHGIAVSAIITQSKQKNKLITQLNEKLYGNGIV